MRLLVFITLFFVVTFSNSWSLEFIDKLLNKTKVYKCHFKEFTGSMFIGINNEFIITNYDEEEKNTTKYPITNENEKNIYAELLVNQKLDRSRTFNKISKELTIDNQPGRVIKNKYYYTVLPCELIEN